MPPFLLSILSMVENRLFLVCGLLAIVSTLIWKKRRLQLPLPPGPRGIPIIGNLLDLPKEKDWEVYQHLAHQHGTQTTSINFGFSRNPPVLAGDVFSLKVLGTTLIILNSIESISDLLEARSAVYSSRAPKPVVDLYVLDLQCSENSMTK